MMNEENECLICNTEIPKSYKSNIMIAQNCNCIYKVHDNCIKEWCSIKSKCLICHEPIKLYSIKRKEEHEPFINNNSVTMPPRMSFFKRIYLIMQIIYL